MRKRLTTFAAGLIIGLATSVSADGGAGAYLAARQASIGGDFENAAEYFARSIMYDPSRPELLERAAFAFMASGEFDRALGYAEKLERDGHKSQIALLAKLAIAAQAEEFETVLSLIGPSSEAKGISDGMVHAWALLGTGNMTAANDAFEALEGQSALAPFAYYSHALAKASVGDFEGAEALMADIDLNPLAGSRRGVVAHAQVLSQLGRNDDALALLEQAFGQRNLDPGLRELKHRLAEGEAVTYDTVRDAREGIAEVYFVLSGALANEVDDGFLLLYARIAQFLDPSHIQAILLAAELWERLGQPEQAVELYKMVPQDDPTFHAAELGRAAALRDLGRDDTAVEVLEQLAKTHADLAIVHTTLADMMRNEEQFEKAIAAYDNAIALMGEGNRTQWFVYYARGISYERLGNWEQAEADFRTALEIQPEQPQVLNYLGYSLVQKEIKLDEALEMIERAVRASPQSGYIVDSLGWALYRLGRYEEAVKHMERAVELMPVDPIVNDHLGDVYWAVGRELEARFQWSRALSFTDYGTAAEEADPDRIRSKLQIGLDAVLEAEGAPPLNMANDKN